MKLDTKKVEAAISKARMAGQRISLARISGLTGYSYHQLYQNGYKHLTNCRSEDEYIKVCEACPQCGNIDRTLYWQTNSISKFKQIWKQSAPRVLKCHKSQAEETFIWGDQVRIEVEDLPIEQRRKYLIRMMF